MSKKINLRIGEILKKKKMTQQELANKVNVSRVWIGQISRGEVNTTIDTLNDIADALEVPIADLFEPETENNFITCPHCGATLKVVKSEEKK